MPSVIIQALGGQCMVEARIKRSRVHLLDLDDEVSLTNAISPGFCRTILKGTDMEFARLASVDWFLYHPDGYVTKWDPAGEGFSPADPRLYDKAIRDRHLELYGQPPGKYQT